MEDSILAEEYGRPFSLLLSSIRFLSARLLVGDNSITSLMDIHRLMGSGTPQNLMRCNHFLSVAYTRWNEPSSSSESGLTFYQQVLKSMEEDMESEEDSKEVQQNAIKALTSQQAAKSWGVRVHGSFYVVGIDEEGTYLIPTMNHDTVYCVVGILKKIYYMVPNAASFPAIQATFLPFYTRLVTDAVIAMDRYQPCASPSLQQQLLATLEEAKEDGRVIRCLRQLQVQGGSLDGTDTATSEQASPSATETKLLKKFFAFPATAPNFMAPGGLLTFRRFGYNEQSNPNHICTILCHRGQLPETTGMFQMRNGLELDSIEVLKEAVKLAKTHGRPRMLLIDQRKCHDRLSFLFEAYADAPGGNTVVDFYHPPSQEESASAMASGPM